MLPLFAFCQDVGEVEWKKVIVKEWSVDAFLTTNGGGIGFEHGRTPNYYDKHFWEIDFLYNAHHKAVRAHSYFANARPYAYGKLCDLFFLHAGYGYQRTIHQKPYWGGVRIRYTLSGGFSLGMALPVYLRIAKFDNATGYYTSESTERYVPEKHNIDDIICRASFFKGIGETSLHPGFYFKTGLNFDFSKDEYTMHALEVGGLIDMVFPFVQQMAFNKAKPFYLCAYIAYHFGKRKGNYE
ncbi:MAG: hypothetical protein MJZ70_04630 [Bacteroidales bacterium]|nr:hypothetical protein [Bacteroidales bacterium]